MLDLFGVLMFGFYAKSILRVFVGTLHKSFYKVDFKNKLNSSLFCVVIMDPENNGDDNAIITKEFRMNEYEQRLSTFQDVWPFTSNCMCTPENVSQQSV